MKTFNSILRRIRDGRFAVALMLLFVAVACQQKLPAPEEVNAKIQDKEALTQADYTTMIDYCGEYAKKAQQYQNIINAEPNDSTPSSIDAQSALSTLYGEYPYLDQFSQVIYSSTNDEIGADNVKKVNEYAKYSAFPLPQGSGANLNQPGVVGDIEDMPQDSGEVIATGDGEAVDIPVK